MLIKTATGVYDHSAVDDFTVIAVGQGTEKTGYVLVVPGDSPYNTTEDLVEAAKAAPGSILMGVETGRKLPHHVWSVCEGNPELM